MKIVQIIGARPQFIKYSAVNEAIIKHNSDSQAYIEDILINTGQHYDYEMSELFFRELGIKEPDYNLEVGSGTHAYQTGLILQKVEVVLAEEQPDAVIVYGDTNSTVGGALAAAKLNFPVLHVEAGLRSFNKKMPEEINRVLTDHLSAVLLCPSESAVAMLKREGFENISNGGGLISKAFEIAAFSPDISNPLIFNVGDVMFDVLNHSLEIAKKDSKILNDLGLVDKEYCVLTIHRAESTESLDAFKILMEFVNEIAFDKCIVFPAHPRTRNMIDTIDINLADNVKLIEPLGYFDLLMLINNSKYVMTDSGGMQKEAYWLKTPCITLRDETEWVETIDNGWNVLYKDYRADHKFHHASGKDAHFYGDGEAAVRIVNILNSIAR